MNKGKLIVANWKMNFLYKNALKTYFLENPNNPIYLYLHIPYCAKLCYYCSCRLHISNNREVINGFVKTLIKECNMLENFFNENKINHETADGNE